MDAKVGACQAGPPRTRRGFGNVGAFDDWRLAPDVAWAYKGLGPSCCATDCNASETRSGAVCAGEATEVSVAGSTSAGRAEREVESERGRFDAVFWAAQDA